MTSRVDIVSINLKTDVKQIKFILLLLINMEGLITITDIFERLVGEIYDEDNVLV